MPRLSIIIPYRNSDRRLEASILSVLENRPEGCEIIVVHDGSYSDPYNLSDELVFIRCAGSPAQQLNQAVASTSAPVLSVLLDGATVGAGWTKAPLAKLQQANAAAVSVATKFENQSNSVFGVDSDAIEDAVKVQQGLVEVKSCNSHAIAAGPQMVCGFYRRRVLQALGGWNEQIDFSIADIEMAWALEALALDCEICPETRVEAPSDLQRTLSTRSVKQLAELAVAYGVSTAGTGTAMTDLLRGCLSGNVSHAVAWATGIVSARANDAIRDRIQSATLSLNASVPFSQPSQPSQPEEKLLRAA